MQPWTRTNCAVPADGRVVETKVDDGRRLGCFLRLKRLGHLWLLPCGEFRTFYTPTHWRPLNQE
jgi:hypothetical protein